jgi:hypothetical protein
MAFEAGEECAQSDKLYDYTDLQPNAAKSELSNANQYAFPEFAQLYRFAVKDTYFGA